MVRRKEFLSQANKPKGKKEQKKLETADDFLAAGVEHEEAAGKWRAGDAAKSMRFFQRAVEVYEQGLQAFPQSLDLAYNKARVQLEICTHPVLVSQIKQPMLEVLQIALASHRYALQLSPDNTDTVFNTSQVLRSIAEEIAGADELPKSEAVQLLEEAWGLLTRCFALQEVRYQESQEEIRIALEQDAAAASSAQESNAPAPESQVNSKGASREDDDDEEEEQWVSVVEPVTKDTLIDTFVAQFETLTTLCSILADAPESAPPAALAFAEKQSSDLLSRYQGLLHDNANRLQEIALARANFVSAMLAAGAKQGKLDPATYKKERDAVFADAALQAQVSVEVMLADAQSLLTFNATLRENPAYDDPAAAAATATLRWNAVAEASKKLSAASQISGIEPDELATTHLLRGDCSMLLHNLQYPPTSHKTAADQALQLLKNAGIFYRNAQKLGTERQDKAVAGLRSSVTAYLQKQEGYSSVGKILAECPQGQEWAIDQIEDMMVEGLLSPDLQMA